MKTTSKFGQMEDYIHFWKLEVKTMINTSTIFTHLTSLLYQAFLLPGLCWIKNSQLIKNTLCLLSCYKYPNISSSEVNWQLQMNLVCFWQLKERGSLSRSHMHIPNNFIRVITPFTIVWVCMEFFYFCILQIQLLYKLYKL
jgi:hypothetical protein